MECQQVINIKTMIDQKIENLFIFMLKGLLPPLSIFESFLLDEHFTCFPFIFSIYFINSFTVMSVNVLKSIGFLDNLS